MVFLLSDQNVIQYLIDQNIQDISAQSSSQIKLRFGKNFNLSITIQNQHFLVKQECHDAQGNTSGEVANEWTIHQFLETFPEVNELRSHLPQALHFNPAASILVSQYFSGFCDLDYFYEDTNFYAPLIAQTLAEAVAQLHRTTFNQESYKDFFLTQAGDSIIRTPSAFRKADRLKPEVFGILCEDALEFFRLYQRFDSLKQAIAQLTWQPSCLIHNDLKLTNVLVGRSWAENPTADPPVGTIRLIDWERFLWGDPAFDVATILASYLSMWLSSLIVSTEVDIETALRLAPTPLEMLQPTLVTFMQVYLQNFPQIIEQDPLFLRRTIAMTGLCLIEKIKAKLEYREPFGNSGICMLQVAKSLLCQPEESIPTVFGVSSFT
jgi:Phosphotransferase enzyme family